MNQKTLDKLQQISIELYSCTIPVEESIRTRSLTGLLNEAMSNEERASLQTVIDASIDVIGAYIDILSEANNKPEYLLSFLESVIESARDLINEMPKAVKGTRGESQEFAARVSEVGAYVSALAKSINDAFSKVLNATSKNDKLGQQTNRLNALASGVDDEGADVDEDISNLANKIVNQIERSIRVPEDYAKESGGALRKIFTSLFSRKKAGQKKLDTKKFTEDLVNLSPAEIVNLAKTLEDQQDEVKDNSDAVKNTMGDSKDKEQNSSESEKLITQIRHNIDQEEQSSERDIGSQLAKDISKQLDVLGTNYKNDKDKAKRLYQTVKKAVNAEVGYDLFEHKHRVDTLERWLKLAGIKENDA